MIDLKVLLNPDALRTIRDALESHVVSLAAPHYRISTTALYPVSDNPATQDTVRVCCELAREIDRTLAGPATWLTDLLVMFEMSDDRTRHRMCKHCQQRIRKLNLDEGGYITTDTEDANCPHAPNHEPGVTP